MPMLIREATVGDLPALEKHAREFYALSTFLHGFRMELFVSAWAGLLATGNAVVFLLERADGSIAGALGGVAYPDLYSGELNAVEFFWFVSEHRRGDGLRLYRAFEQWARAKKCSRIRMAFLCDLMPERLDVVYRRLGFERSEVLYTKTLKPSA